MSCSATCSLMSRTAMLPLSDWTGGVTVCSASACPETVDGLAVARRLDDWAGFLGIGVPPGGLVWHQGSTRTSPATSGQVSLAHAAVVGYALHMTTNTNPTPVATIARGTSTCAVCLCAVFDGEPVLAANGVMVHFGCSGVQR